MKLKTLLLLAVLMVPAYAYTNATCLTNNTLRTIFNYSWVVNGTVYNVSRTNDLYCPLGCISGPQGGLCNASILADNPVLTIIIALAAGLILLFTALKWSGKVKLP